MAKYVIDESTLKGIGDAIRAKKGTSDPIPVPSLASEISSIESGGSDPTYKVIPLGKYVFHPNSEADLELSIAEWYDEVNDYYNLYPDWFTAYVESEERTITGFGMHCTFETSEVECYYSQDDWLDFYITDGTVITVITEIEVPEEQYNAFMQYFTPYTPEYNGVIPLGTYTLVRKDVWADEDAFDIIEDGDGNPLADWFTINGKGYFGIDYYEYSCDMYYNQTGYFCDSFEGDVTIEVTREIEVTEEQYNEFIKVFTLQ